MVKLALALAVAVAAPGFGAAATCPFFRAVVENERLVELNLLDPDCQERPSSFHKTKSRRYVPCSREGDPIMVQHFVSPGCVGEPLKVVPEVPGVCTARITQVYQANQDQNENHCAAFFSSTAKMPLNQATVFPKVSYYAPGQCRMFKASVNIGEGGTTVGEASSGSWACNADGSVTYRKFVSANCTGASIATTLSKSPRSGCIEPTGIDNAEIGFGACVSVCAADAGGALPPSGQPSTVPLLPSQQPSQLPGPGTGVVSPGVSGANQSSSGGSLAVPLVLPVWIAARLLALLRR
jgi:hypothetical protein